MLVIQYVDRFGNVKFEKSEDYRNIMDIIAQLHYLQDRQVEKQNRCFTKAFGEWRPDRVQVYRGTGFQVFSTYDNIIKGKNLNQGQILSNILLSYQGSSKKEQFTILYDKLWAVDISIGSDYTLEFWVAHKDKGDIKLSPVKVVDYRRCYADIPIKKGVESKILYTYKQLILNRLIKGNNMLSIVDEQKIFD